MSQQKSDAITTRVDPVVGHEFNLYSPLKQRQVGAVVELVDEAGEQVGIARCIADLAEDPKHIKDGVRHGRDYYRYRVIGS